jgi:hypothetical protein
MGKIGYGYGSEWHLLRYLGDHREYLTNEVLKLTGGNSVRWFDFHFSPVRAPLRDDRELVGLEFIDSPHVQDAWREFWPQSGNSQNWDAVGEVHYGDSKEWLLVEAKAHLDEIRNPCKATSSSSRKKIKLALQSTSAAFGNTAKSIDNWLDGYYQYTNRLAVLHFLMSVCSSPENAQLLFVYFVGDYREDTVCPQSEAEWAPFLEEMDACLGLDKNCPLAARVHRLFLPVNPCKTTSCPAENIARCTTVPTAGVDSLR